MSYPDNNPKTIYGMKKAPLHLVPPSALIVEAQAFKLGAEKYGPYNWRANRVSASIYVAAALRHLLAWHDGEEVDRESGASHLGHARACLAILVDAQSVGNLNDDRPIAGEAGAMFASMVPAGSVADPAPLPVQAPPREPGSDDDKGEAPTYGGTCQCECGKVGCPDYVPF